ncbi:MAG: DUF1559 domain-containing protein [Planctomycetes bacterium]|nr:DUF1559 domain-containing protein [Planctomycetota bacterium]
MIIVDIRRDCFRRNVNVILILLVVAALGYLAAILFRHYEAADSREDGKRAETCLRLIANGLSNYAESKGNYPASEICDASGKRLASWRLEILPWLDGNSFTGKFNRHWTSYKQIVSSKNVFTMFGRTRREGSCVSAIVGDDSIFDERNAMRVSELLRSGGEDVIVLVEVRNMPFHWMAPGDLTVADFDNDGICGSVKWIRDVPGQSFHVCFLDGTIWYLAKDTPARTVRTFMKVETAIMNERERSLSAYLTSSEN